MVCKVLSWVMWVVPGRGKTRTGSQVRQQVGKNTDSGSGVPVWNTHSLGCSLSDYMVMVLNLGIQPRALLTLSKPSILHILKPQMD